MSTHRAINRVCCAALALAVLAAVLFCNAERFGLQRMDAVQGYEARLFDPSRVHTVEIVMDDWEGFLAGCEDEEYESCAVIIDGEAYKNVALRAKGNTSLSSVKVYGNNRYSFKIEFDHYDDGNTYYGLDKLCLNNIIQDNTYLKDYLSYTLMREFGVPSPLCSFTYITVNGEEWGLYIAVEALEDGFLTRNYGNSYGELYKPDSMSFGGGRGNGGGFNMEDLEGLEDGEAPAGMPQPPEGFPEGMPQPQEGFPADMPQPENAAGEPGQSGGPSQDGAPGQQPDGRRGGGPGGFGGMGSNDVKLQYIDNDPDSYPNIFENAKTDITNADQTRLIEALRKLSAGEDIENTVNVDEVIRYMVVHHFLCNDDSYTGQMVHNYYLYEEDGQLSMLPWDYNLAFGGFGGGGFGGATGTSGATATVNTPIDTLVSGGSLEDRPMAAWIFSSEAYTALYHKRYAEFVASLTADYGLVEKIDEIAEQIAPFVEKDPTKFCTYEEFETGVETLREFCTLRLESISGQLEGTVPSTSEGQQQEGANLVDASHIEIADMGSMGRGGFGGAPGERPDNGEDGAASDGGRMAKTAGGMGITVVATNTNSLTAAMPTGGDTAAKAGMEYGAEIGRPGKGVSRSAKDGEMDAVGSGNAIKDEGAESGQPSQAAAEGEDAAQETEPRNPSQMRRDFPGNMGQESDAAEPNRLLWLGVSAAVLLAGLGFALKFRQ